MTSFYDVQAWNKQDMTSSILKAWLPIMASTVKNSIDRLQNRNKRRQLLKLYTFLKIHPFHKNVLEV